MGTTARMRLEDAAMTRACRRMLATVAAALTLTAAGLALAETASAHPIWVLRPVVVGIPQKGGALEGFWAARAGHYLIDPDHLNEAPEISSWEVVWQRCPVPTGTCTNIPETYLDGGGYGSAGHLYIPKAADVGMKLRLKVTVYDQPPEYGGDGGASTMYSDAVGPVTP